MKRLSTVVLMIALSLSCGGYKEKSSPLSPDQVQITDMATALMNDAAALQQSSPPALKDSMDALSDASVKFQNLCLRLSSNSLETRKAFDQIMFFDAQISQSPELQKQPEFNTRWQDFHKNRVNPLAKKLGYRPES